MKSIHAMQVLSLSLLCLVCLVDCALPAQEVCTALREKTFDRPHLGPEVQTLRLPWRSWLSSRAAHAVVKVTLEDIIGYAVEWYEALTPSWRDWAPDIVDNKFYDVDAELWTVKDYIVQEYVTERQEAEIVGDIGYEGRSGIWVSERTVDNQAEAGWYKFWQDSSNLQQLMLWTRNEAAFKSFLGDDFPVCKDDLECSGCADGKWCDSGSYIPPHCQGPTPCVELLHKKPGSDAGYVEQLIMNHMLNVVVSYYGSSKMTSKSLALAEEAKYTYLVYGYTPDPFFTRAKLKRLSFPDWTEGCNNGNTNDPSGPIRCDFPSKFLKIVTGTALRTKAPRAMYLLKNMQLFGPDITEIMSSTEAGGGTDSTQTAACKWILSNLDRVLTSWVPQCIRRNASKPALRGEAVFNEQAIECEVFGGSCPDGKVPQDTPGSNGSKIEPCWNCTKGRFQDGTACRPCIKGYFQPLEGQNHCEGCPSGNFNNDTGSTSCVKCSVGRFAQTEGMTACPDCLPGTYATDEATQFCTRCKEGFVAINEGQSGCQGCTSGTYSIWGGFYCANCTAGTYQDEEHSSMCKSCPAGATCPHQGMTYAYNRPGYWTWYEYDHQLQVQNLHWEPCITPQECLIGEQCFPGSSGLLCHTCLPGYVRSPGSPYCGGCPSELQNSVITVLVFGGALTFVYVMTVATLLSAGRSKAIYAAILKLLLHYSLSMHVVGIFFVKTLVDRGFRQIVEELLWPILPLLDFDGTMFVETALWQPICFSQPTLAPEEESLVGKLEASKHSEFFSQAMEEAKDILSAFHETTEFVHVCGVIFIPIGFCLATTLIAAVVVLIYMVCRGHIYQKAHNFILHVKQHGFSEEHRGGGHTDWTDHVQTFEYRLLGVWHCSSLAKHDIISLRWWQNFFRGTHPLLIVGLFTTYPVVVKALLRPLHCRAVGDDPTFRMSASLDIECYHGRLFILSVLGSVLWGIGLPIFFYSMLRRRHNKLLHKGMLERWGFLYIGYELQNYGWESVILIRKAMVYTISAVHLESNKTLLLLFLFAALGSLVLHLKRKPFDNRYDEILDRIELRHLSVWVLSCSILLVLNIAETAFQVTALGLICIFLHMTFLFTTLVILAKHLRTGMVEYLAIKFNYQKDMEALHRFFSESSVQSTVTSKAHYQALKEVGSGAFYMTHLHIHDAMIWFDSASLVQFFINRHLAHLSEKPYVCFNPDKGWVTICGSHGHSCPLPKIGKSQTFPSEVEFAHDAIQEARQRDRRYLMRIIAEAVTHVIVTMKPLSWSCLILDFVMRAGFALHGKQKTRPHSLAEHKAKRLVGKATVEIDRIIHEKELIRLKQDFGKRKDEEARRKKEMHRPVKSADELHNELLAMQKDPETGVEDVALVDEAFEGQVNMEDLLEDVDETHLVIARMFNPVIFKRGLLLYEFQLNLILMQRWPRQRLVESLDIFEDRWHEEFRLRRMTCDGRLHTQEGDAIVEGWGTVKAVQTRQFVKVDETNITSPFDMQKSEIANGKGHHDLRQDHENGKRALDMNGHHKVGKVPKAALDTRLHDQNALFDMGTQTDTSDSAIIGGIWSSWEFITLALLGKEHSRRLLGCAARAYKTLRQQRAAIENTARATEKHEAELQRHTHRISAASFADWYRDDEIQEHIPEEPVAGPGLREAAQSQLPKPGSVGAVQVANGMSRNKAGPSSQGTQDPFLLDPAMQLPSSANGVGLSTHAEASTGNVAKLADIQTRPAVQGSQTNAAKEQQRTCHMPFEDCATEIMVHPHVDERGENPYTNRIKVPVNAYQKRPDQINARTAPASVAPDLSLCGPVVTAQCMPEAVDPNGGHSSVAERLQRDAKQKAQMQALGVRQVNRI